jgi:predicted dehydrogenase
MGKSNDDQGQDPRRHHRRNPDRGFASVAHIPALRSLPDFEITAVCTTRQQSAEATAKHFDIPLAFSDPVALARTPKLIW